ncbi:MAG: protease complex subunit PrcB family protein [Lachnospiraceae bacterium]|nr:protease complex subunit PrcB family protein [Lachnospiraceae bacterium]
MKKYIFLSGVLLIAIYMGACHSKTSDEKVDDVEFTVCDDSKVPKEFLGEINKKKEQTFVSTFSDGEFMFIAKGYGRQETGGYSISVTDLYYTKDKIVMKTKLVGPGQKDLVLRGATYPYIVVKMEYSQKDVVCDD